MAMKSLSMSFIAASALQRAQLAASGAILMQAA